MTKAQYFELCEALGSEPLEEEIPPEFEDLPDLLQLSFSIYETLRDDWDYMGGNYIGKSLLHLFEVLKLHNVPEDEYLLVYKIIVKIDNERRNILRVKNKT